MKIICEMNHLELEKELTAKIRKRRLLEGGVTVFLFVMGIVFAILYDNSKAYEEGLLGGLGVVDSNMALYWLMAGCFMAAAVCAIIPIIDLLYSKFETFEACGGYITLYRGMLKNYLYFNGELKAASAGYYLEAKLPGGTKVTVSFGRWSAHISFSNGRSPIYF
jgi:hypothetical protein